MEFRQYSITHFCNIIYGLSDVPYYTQEFSSIEMYEFLKEKSNNFDLITFEYLIHDIRNYSDNIQFKISNPVQMPELVIDKVTGYPTTKSQELFDAYEPYIIRPLASIILYIDFDVDLKFSNEQSIKERIQLFKKALPGATILHNISNLIKFSEMAEEEFKKSQFKEIQKVNNSRIQSFSTTRIPAASSILKDINKDNFIDLIREIGKLMPDIEVRRVFLEKRFIEMGYSIEMGYKQTTYFYNEIKNARDEQESIYKGKLFKTDTTFALVDSFKSIFKFNYNSFDKLEELFCNHTKHITTINSNNSTFDLTDDYAPTLQTIWKTIDELTVAHCKFNKILKCDLVTWLYWFGGISINNPKKIKWIYKNGNKRALTYFIEKISLSQSIDYANTRKIFDIQVYNKDKYEYSFEEIDNILK